MILKITALALAPRGVLAKRKFFLSITNGLMERSAKKLLVLNLFWSQGLRILAIQKARQAQALPVHDVFDNAHQDLGFANRTQYQTVDYNTVYLGGLQSFLYLLEKEI